MNPLELTLNEYLLFAFVLMRMSGLVVFAPFFGSENFPVLTRIGLSVFLAFCVFKRAAGTMPGPFELSLVGLGILAIREVFVGLVLGYGAGLVFTAMQMAGELIGQQIGFTLANVVDPMLEEEVGIISYLKSFLAIAVFMSLNLHLVLIHILGMSYEFVALGQAVFSVELMGKISDMFGLIWDYAIRAGGPVILVMLLVSVVVGFLVRTMPQLNIIVIGLPSRTIIGLLALFLGITPFVLTVEILCEEMLKDVGILIRLLAPATSAGVVVAPY